MIFSFDAIRALGGPLFIILWGMIVLLLDLGPTGVARRRALPIITIIGVIVAAFLSITSVIGVQAPGAAATQLAPTFFGGGMASDRFGALFCLILCIVAFFAILMSDRYLTEKGINQGEFYALILFSTSGAMLMAMSYDLVNVFVGLEILSVSLYILAGFARRERRSEEAAVKYFLLGAFASGFLLYGIALVYGSVGIAVHAHTDVASSQMGAGYTNLTIISQALQATQDTAAPLLSSPIFVAGIAMIIVGLGFKAAIVPFHSYAPDVYEGAPTPVTAFMSVAAKIGAFAALIRLLLAIASSGETGPFHSVIWGLAVATMVVGNVLAIRQTNIKRMLAYSSIAHAGYILVGVLASTSQDPIAAELAQNAIRYYLFAYTFMNLGAFAIIIWLGHGSRGEYLSIRDYDGLGKRNPLAAAAMTVIMLSLAGIPPTAGFVGKLYLFMSAFQAGEPVLATIALVISAIGVFYYLGLVVAMYFREPSRSFDDLRGGGARLTAVLCVVGILLFGVVPATSFDFAPTTAAAAAAAADQAPAGGSGRGASAPRTASFSSAAPAPKRRRRPAPVASPSALPIPSPTAPTEATPVPEALSPTPVVPSPAPVAEPVTAAPTEIKGPSAAPGPNAIQPTTPTAPQNAARPTPASPALAPPASRP